MPLIIKISCSQQALIKKIVNLKKLIFFLIFSARNAIGYLETLFVCILAVTLFANLAALKLEAYAIIVDKWSKYAKLISLQAT